jgi:hypothetical protein
MGLEAQVIAWRPGGYTTALRLWALWGVLLLICCTIPSHPAATQEASYVVMGARGDVARIVFQGDAPCPQIALDGVQQAMAGGVLDRAMTGERLSYFPVDPAFVCAEM